MLVYTKNVHCILQCKYLQLTIYQKFLNFSQNINLHINYHTVIFIYLFFYHQIKFIDSLIDKIPLTSI